MMVDHAVVRLIVMILIDRHHRESLVSTRRHIVLVEIAHQHDGIVIDRSVTERTKSVVNRGIYLLAIIGSVITYLCA